ncbi:MAG: hypothetical protein Q7R44_00385 [bacterium]|nr:hypothetical protein [bacterium]
MAGKSRERTERAEEALISGELKILTLPPGKTRSAEVLDASKEKTALFVPKSILFEAAGFSQSSFSPDVLVTRDVTSVLATIFQHGAVANRYGAGGLEQDPTRQQIIIYTLVVCNEHLLWYQRATKENLKTVDPKHHGDPRLQGRFSVGFGGHKTRDDISIAEEELMFLKDLLPVIRGGLGRMLGLNHGFLQEAQEELGIKRHDLKDLALLGAFYDARFEDPFVDIQVGWVHTGVVAVIEVDPDSLEHLTYKLREIADAWWVPLKDIQKELEKKQSDYAGGQGPKVESWTEVVLREFWPDFLQKIKSGN